MKIIEIVKQDITAQETGAVVNAANEKLARGSGVSGAIFGAAGAGELEEACSKLAPCPTGSAVITPGFRLKAGNIIHAVGPVWAGGNSGEAELLRSAYTSSLDIAEQRGISSIAFPLISSGAFGYPRDLAWNEALDACIAWQNAHPESGMQIRFCVIDDDFLQSGQLIYIRKQVAADESYRSAPAAEGISLYWDPDSVIKASVENGQIVISANRDGLQSLGHNLLKLAETEPGNHFHLDQYNSLEEGSAEIVFEITD